MKPSAKPTRKEKAMPLPRVHPRGRVALLTLIWLLTNSKLGLAQSNVVAWGNDNYGKTDVPAGLTDAVAVTGGFSHSLALRFGGMAVAWGDSRYGQTSIPPELTNAVAIAAGAAGFYSLALRPNGHLVAWPSSNSVAIHLPNDLTNAVAIAAGTDHALALRADGTVSVWGENYFGQLGLPPSLTNVVAIAAGDLHSLALKADGTVVAWGGPNSCGELYAPPDLTNAVAIAAGGAQSLALKPDGTVVAWGCTDPVPPSLTNVVGIAAGSLHVLALRTDGTIAAWGDSGSGQASVPLGLTNAVATAAGAYDSLALIGSGPPFITTPLVDRTTVRGASVYFRAAASGARPLNYQWQFNGTNLPAAQNSVLVLTNTQPTQSGIYTLIVSNAEGLASSSALLAVISQTARILTDSLTITNGHFQFNATASPRGTLWIVQASTNVTEWVNIYTLSSYNDPMTFTDPSTNFNRRFYRLRLKP
jgi:hypothetical protein